ncbi:radical SAM protein [Candidatus Woesearchaeota archaeon]|jgi:Fe-coproporphyrin III synthase|nr:radical SAM protein [Candidatus Woesearchaeota archaeon]MBT5397212.1 radical SAM protein [Candidatus Woesearchaeota archaeon]MBT5924431.1 radical SAM protein [Candidatus Woesearchaeota archaeon]MBT6367242.1 radical SAM protein [Candidatus Woesearchaeota archaeon]MBT7762612.1 radical SAM protein [Candidatus Woesearchaeota archaeon]
MLNKVLHKTRVAVTKIKPVYTIARKVYYNRELKRLKEIYTQTLKSGDAPFPEMVIFEPTARCNLKCKMCFFNRLAQVKKDVPELTMDEIKEIFTKNTFKKVNIIGGEPMMHGNILDTMHLFDSLDMKYDLATNGTLINKMNIDTLSAMKGLVSVGMSLDGNQEMHNEIRGSPVAFQQTINSFKMLHERGILTNIVSVVMKENLPYMKDIVKIAKENNIKSVWFEIERYYIKDEIAQTQSLLKVSDEDKDDVFPLMIIDEYKREYSLDELKKSLEEVQEYGNNNGVNVFFYPEYLLTKVEECHARTLRRNGRYMCRFINRARIDPYGNVIHCGQLRKSFGNLKEKSFKEIWNSIEYKEFRMNLLNHNLMPICETCLNMVKIN